MGLQMKFFDVAGKNRVNDIIGCIFTEYLLFYIIHLK